MDIIFFLVENILIHLMGSIPSILESLYKGISRHIHEKLKTLSTTLILSMYVLQIFVQIFCQKREDGVR